MLHDLELVRQLDPNFLGGHDHPVLGLFIDDLANRRRQFSVGFQIHCLTSAASGLRDLAPRADQRFSVFTTL